MPTTKPRYAITETDAVAQALALARRRWPGQPTSRLLTHLIEAGAQVVGSEEAARSSAHDDAAAALTELGGFYSDDYLDDIRQGWQ